MLREFSRHQLIRGQKISSHGARSATGAGINNQNDNPPQGIRPVFQDDGCVVSGLGSFLTDST